MADEDARPDRPRRAREKHRGSRRRVTPPCSEERLAGTCLEEALALGLEGRTDEAIALLERLPSPSPRAGAGAPPGPTLARARLLLAGGLPGAVPEATRLLEESGNQHDEAWRAWLALARLRSREGNPADAAALLKQALEGFRLQGPGVGDYQAALAALISCEVARLQANTREVAASGLQLHPAPPPAESLVALIHLGRELAAETDPDEVLRTVLQGAISLAGAERGFVVLVRGDGLEFAVAENLDRTEVEEPAFEVSRSLIREVARSGQVELLNTLELPDGHPAGKSLGALGVRSAACVPIRHDGEVLGVLYLDHRGPGADLGRPQRQVLELFAAQAGAALLNARAHVEKARALAAAEETIRRQRSDERRRRGYHGMVGASDAMQEVYRHLDVITPTEEPVLLLGETGTGKEIAARLIHSRGPRREREFVAVNCAGLTETLLESELFGYERGAFTGADRSRPGLFEVADRGTLFLDEVGDMSPRMQADLLRVLQTGEIRRVGGRSTIHVDVRVIAATHRDLAKRVDRGEFRQDLYFRLNVLTLRLPPLRERPEDVPALVEALLSRLVKEGAAVPRFTGRAMERLMAYSWPGNVRELENVLRRVAALGAAEVRSRHLPDEIRRGGRPVRAGTLREAEWKAIRAALDAAGGNKAEAARILGVDRTTLYAKLRRFGK